VKRSESRGASVRTEKKVRIAIEGEGEVSSSSTSNNNTTTNNNNTSNNTSNNTTSNNNNNNNLLSTYYHHDRPASPVVTDRLSVRAKDVLKLKLVSASSDFDDVNKEFAPTYTHQIFVDERFSGYIEPRIELFASASSLFLYLKLHYEKKTENAEAVVEKIAERIEGKWTDNKTTFLKVRSSNKKRKKEVGE